MRINSKKKANDHKNINTCSMSLTWRGMCIKYTEMLLLTSSLAKSKKTTNLIDKALENVHSHALLISMKN